MPEEAGGIQTPSQITLQETVYIPLGGWAVARETTRSIDWEEPAARQPPHGWHTYMRHPNRCDTASAASRSALAISGTLSSVIRLVGPGMLMAATTAPP